MSVRVPKGVTIDGQAWGGRFVSRDQLISLAAATDGSGLRAIERLVEREYRKAAAVHQRVADKYVDAPGRYRERRQLAQFQQQEWERVLDAAKDFQATTPAQAKGQRHGQRASGRLPESGRGVGARGRGGRKAKTAKGKRAAVTRITQKSEQVRPAVKGAVEWEIGFKYRTSRAGKRSSDVDVNLRLRRVDGRAFTHDMAQKVLTHVRRTQETPDGFLIAGVDWKRPYAGTAWRHGSVGDMENFWAPMFSRDRATRAWDVKATDVRYGAVKQGDDDDDE